MNKKDNPLGIRSGDTVRINFAHDTERGPFVAKVTDISDRVMMGSDAYIEYVPEIRTPETEELGIPYGCSASHVVEVLERAPYQCTPSASPTNIFRERLIERAKEDGDGWPGFYQFGDIRVGFREPEALVMRALAEAKDCLDRPLDLERFIALWEKAGCPGRVEIPIKPEMKFFREGRHYTAVRWKVFRAFVLANRHRILLSRKEMEAEGRRYREIMWEDTNTKHDSEEFEEMCEVA